ncbi:MAG: class I SAM-dependent methyltransferase, partial [Alphaproteobacteria bacterium]
LGCGLGGATLMLHRDHNAGHVTGIDVETDSLERARVAVEAAGVAGRVTLRHVMPWPMPFGDGEFDVVFCKDVVSHMTDKAAFLTEPYRVLKPGGRLICADFFEGMGDDGSHAGADDFVGYVRETVNYGLTFHFEPQAVYGQGLRAAGFVDLEFIDHNGPPTEISRRDLQRLAGPEGERIKGLLGDDMFATRVRASRFRNAALESGGLQHFICAHAARSSE